MAVALRRYKYRRKRRRGDTRASLLIKLLVTLVCALCSGFPRGALAQTAANDGIMLPTAEEQEPASRRRLAACSATQISAGCCDRMFARGAKWDLTSQRTGGPTAGTWEMRTWDTIEPAVQEAGPQNVGWAAEGTGAARVWKTSMPFDFLQGQYNAAKSAEARLKHTFANDTIEARFKVEAPTRALAEFWRAMFYTAAAQSFFVDNAVVQIVNQRDRKRAELCAAGVDQACPYYIEPSGAATEQAVHVTGLGRLDPVSTGTSDPRVAFTTDMFKLPTLYLNVWHLLGAFIFCVVVLLCFWYRKYLEELTIQHMEMLGLRLDDLSMDSSYYTGSSYEYVFTDESATTTTESSSDPSSQSSSRWSSSRSSPHSSSHYSSSRGGSSSGKEIVISLRLKNRRGAKYPDAEVKKQYLV